MMTGLIRLFCSGGPPFRMGYRLRVVGPRIMVQLSIPDLEAKIRRCIPVPSLGSALPFAFWRYDGSGRGV